jgi:hypothetical protein
MSALERYEEALGTFKNTTVLQDLSLEGKVIVVTGQSVFEGERASISEINTIHRRRSWNWPRALPGRRGSRRIGRCYWVPSRA